MHVAEAAAQARPVREDAAGERERRGGQRGRYAGVDRTQDGNAREELVLQGVEPVGLAVQGQGGGARQALAVLLVGAVALERAGVGDVVVLAVAAGGRDGRRGRLGRSSFSQQVLEPCERQRLWVGRLAKAGRPTLAQVDVGDRAADLEREAQSQ